VRIFRAKIYRLDLILFVNFRPQSEHCPNKQTLNLF